MPLVEKGCSEEVWGDFGEEGLLGELIVVVEEDGVGLDEEGSEDEWIGRKREFWSE